jgi:hypothetical protein
MMLQKNQTVCHGGTKEAVLRQNQPMQRVEV